MLVELYKMVGMEDRRAVVLLMEQSSWARCWVKVLENTTGVINYYHCSSLRPQQLEMDKVLDGSKGLG